jgi:hypothetical protein
MAKLAAICLAAVMAVEAVIGLTSGLINGDMLRACVAALSAGVPAGVVIALTVTGWVFRQDGHDGWLATCAPILLFPAVMVSFYGLAVPFIVFSNGILRDAPTPLDVLWQPGAFVLALALGAFIAQFVIGLIGGLVFRQSA